MLRRDDGALGIQQSSSAFSSSRVDDASQDFDGLELTSSMRIRKKVAIGGITPFSSPEETPSPRRKGSVLFLDPVAPPAMSREENDDLDSPQSSKYMLDSGDYSPLSPVSPQSPQSAFHSGSSRSHQPFLSPENDDHVAKSEEDCIDAIVHWCNSLSTRAPCRIGGKRLSISLSWCVQWFLVINLTVLVIATSLLFNYYALTLVNDTAESFLYTALWQTQGALDRSLSDMSRGITELTLSAGGVTVVNLDNSSDTRWPGWQSWASPNYGLNNSTQAQRWEPERRLAHVAAVQSCRTMREGTIAIQLAYRLVAPRWLGGCIRTEFATGTSSGSWATEFVGFVLYQKRVVWVQTVLGVTSSKPLMQSWTTLLEGMSWIDDPIELAQLLQAVWVLQGLSSPPLSLAIIAVDVVNNGTASLVKSAAEEEEEEIGNALVPVVIPVNTTWVLEPFSNGTIASINAVQWSRSLLQTVERSDGNSSITTPSTNDGGGSVKNSTSRTLSFSSSITATRDEYVYTDTFTIMNISANGQLSAALDRVAQTSSSGVSIDVVANGNGAVLLWASAAGYYVSPSSFIVNKGLQELYCTVETMSNGTASWLTGIAQDGTTSLRHLAANAWTIRVSSGDSIVGSLARGTYVVIVVCVAISIAVSIGGLMALRLLLNPLDQVHRDIRHASALQFHRIDPSKFPPSILREMNLVTRSFLQLVKKLQSYRSVLMDVYDTSMRSRSSSLNSSSDLFLSMDGSSLGTSFASSSNTGDDSLSSSGTFIGELSTSLAMGTAEDLEFLSTIRKGSFVNPLLDKDALNTEEAEQDNKHLLKVQLAYISRRHTGRQRKQATFEHTYRDGAADMLHNFRTDCLKNLQLSVFEEVRTHIQCNGVYVEVRNDTQLSDAFSVARGELLVRMTKSGVKKVLSPVALLVDLLNFAINIALITLALINTRSGTPARLSINVFFGLYATAFFINLCITLILLKQGQQDPRMKVWLSQAGLEVSLMLIFCALNTQNIHFLWSQWSVGLKFNAPRVHLLWKRGIVYSLFGFVALDLMQVGYKVYRIIGGEDLVALSVIGLLIACLSIALSLKKRGDFILYYFHKWRYGTKQSTPGAGEPSEEGGQELDSFRNGATWMRRPRAGLSVPMFSEEATVVLFRCSIPLPEAPPSSDPVALQRQHNKVAAHLNRFFSLIFSEVTQAQGHVLWFHGTEVAVCFNSPKPLEYHTPKALKCVLQIHRGLAQQQLQIAAPHQLAGATFAAPPPPHTVPLVAALVRDQYLFGTLGGSSRRVFQCFADWDELQRMLNFAESTKHIGVVTLKRCVPHLTTEGVSGGGGVASRAPQSRSGGSTAAKATKSSPFLDSLMYHDVLGVDQVYVEIPIVHQPRDKRPVSVLSRVLRPLGILADPSDDAHSILTKFISEFTSSGTRTAIPMEEMMNFSKKKSVTICEDQNTSLSARRGSADVSSPSSLPPSALKKSSPSKDIVLSDSEGGEEFTDDDEEPGMSAETRQGSSSTNSAHSWRRVKPASPRTPNGGGASGVTIGSKDLRKMFPGAF
ncbi:transmembrane protein, putative [Bodo saltans]|uniref:Transmembrane protein, putative n=1 Tax=Bodo saltans TaxID=75058 RepID=A0A0S4JPS8_BODSA|nr:transmembrane protein, putative [Bodo saltans]|eukprot:CUG92134.1 transmembrane protein, putative [Bodo saltans]